jgi:uncharacterized protein DUF3367
MVGSYLRQIVTKYASAELVVAVVLLVLPSVIYLSHIVVQDYSQYFVPSPNELRQLFYSWQPSKLGVANASGLWRLFPVSAYFLLLNNVMHVPTNITGALLMALLRLGGFFGFWALLREIAKPAKLSQRAVIIASLFFVYNLYTLVYYSGSFIILVPYFALPVQLLLFIKGLRAQQTAKYAILLGLVNASVFGVNLDYDVIAICLVAAYGLFALLTKETSIGRLVKLVAITIATTAVLVVWWLLPMLGASLADKQTTSFVLSSENFYNLATTPFNLIRHLGDWGFFSSYNGQPYHNFSSWYIGGGPVVISGFLLAIVIYSGTLLIGRSIGNRRRQVLLLAFCLMLVLLPFAGGTNSQWASAGVMQWLFKHIPYFEALRNTYKWMSLEVLLGAVVLGYVCAQVYDSRRLPGAAKFLLGMALTALIVVNTAPIWTGRIYQANVQMTSVPSYWLRAANYVNTQLNSTRDKLFLLPDQYFDIFNWPSGQIIFPDNIEEDFFKVPVAQDVCKGCAQANSARALSFLYGNTGSSNWLKLLGLYNFSYILERRDYAYSYYKEPAPSQVAQMLTGHGLSIFKSFGKLDFYEVPKALVYPRVYSPTQFIETDDLSNSLHLFDAYTITNHNTGYAVESDQGNTALMKALDTGYYAQTFHSNVKVNGAQATQQLEIPASGNYAITQMPGTDSVMYAVKYELTPSGYVLNFSSFSENMSVNGIPVISNKTSASSATVKLGPSLRGELGVKVGDQTYYLTPHSNWSTLPTVHLANGSTNKLYVFNIKPPSPNLLSNGSFESGPWEQSASDCAGTTVSPNISGSVVTSDHTNGKYALQLDARQDSACESSAPINEFQASNTYLVTFDYKTLAGSSGAYCVWDGTSCVIYQTTPSGNGWQTQHAMVTLKPSAKELVVYLYAPTNNYPETKVLYDNVSVTKLGDAIQVLPVPAQALGPASVHPFHLAHGTASLSATLNINSQNLLPNGAFQAGLWQPAPSDCNYLGNAVKLGEKLVPGGVNGQNSMQLSANGDEACISSAPLKSFSDTNTYLVSLNYKNLAAGSGAICIWNGSSCLAHISLTSHDKQWHSFATWFSPGDNAASLELYLYADASAYPAITRFGNIQIRELDGPQPADFSIQRLDPSQNAALTISDYKQVDPTVYQAQLLAPYSGLVILQESYHPDWKAYLVKPGSHVDIWQKLGFSRAGWQLPERDHVTANGYANAWIVQQSQLPKDLAGSPKLTLVMAFAPQRWFYMGSLVSLAGLLTAVGYLLYLRRKHHD